MTGIQRCLGMHMNNIEPDEDEQQATMCMWGPVKSGYANEAATGNPGNGPLYALDATELSGPTLGFYKCDNYPDCTNPECQRLVAHRQAKKAEKAQAEKANAALAAKKPASKAR